MADRINSEARSRLMAKIGSKNTRPEIMVRRTAHALGLRFRLHRKDLPGTPDLVFPKWNAVVFVHGCFWHGHGCSKGRLPKSREDYWVPKIEANQRRDAAKTDALEKANWRVLTLWQCQLADPTAVGKTLKEFMTATDFRSTSLSL